MPVGPQMATDQRIRAGAPMPHPGITGPTTAPGQILFWISATRCSWAAGEAARAPRLATRRPPTQGWLRPCLASPGQASPGRADAWASAREPTSMKSCGRRSRSAASATSSSGMTWRRTSRSPRPRAPPSRIPGSGTGRSRRRRRRRLGRPQPRPSAARPSAARPPVPGPPAATQPVQNMKSQGPGATHPVRAATGPSPLRSASSQPVNAPSQPVNAPSQPVNAPSQPVSAAAPPAEPRGRRRASRNDDEDPLTSAAFSLRSSGPVDGRSSRRSRDTTRDQYDAVAQETQTFSAAETEAASGGYPGGVPPFRQSESSAGGRPPSSYSGTSYDEPSSVTQAMNTPPYGETYGYGSGGSPARRPSRTTRGGRTAPGATPGIAVPAKRPGPRGRRTRRTPIRAPAAIRPMVTKAQGATRSADTRAADTRAADTRPGDIQTEDIRATATRPAATRTARSRATPMATEAMAIALRMTRRTTTGG